MRIDSLKIPASIMDCKRSASVQSLSAFGWPLLFVVLVSMWSNPIQANCLISCRSSLNISLGSNGQAELTPGFLLQDPTCDPLEFTVNITDNNNNSYGSIIDCTMLGLELTATVTHTISGNFCRTTVQVLDYLPPVIACMDTVLLCIESASPDSIGYPAISDNCSSLDSSALSYSDQFSDLACYTNHNGDSITSMIERTWQATDNEGNTSSCVQHIYLKRATIADVDFPAHRNGFSNPALDCSQDPTDLSLAGEPTINGKPITNGGYCELVVSFSDQIIAGCSPASYKILRTWTIIDWCSDEFTLNVQIIKVEDSTDPVINCPANMTVGTGVFSCTATVTLPAAMATDDCSNFTITPSWTFGTGYGPFNNVPLGTHTVTYTATDDCGNSSSCEMTVTVIDNIAPTTVCDIQTQVDLTTDGFAEVFALTFDDGSHDNCTLDRMEVSRDAINYGNSVIFDCNDVGAGFLPVWLRVYDAAGNTNECEVSVEVIDRFRPAIYCPSMVYIECTDDYEDLQITGEPLVDDNCTVDTVYYTDQLNINSCHVGTISRRWTVKDTYGNETYCSQLIVVEDHTEVTVSFPIDFSTNICGAETEPAVTGEPVISNAQCESMWITHTDEVFNVAGPACKKIFRTWKVINWCIYQANSGSNEGLWEHIQLITIIDEDTPTITCPADTLIGSLSSDCGLTTVQLAPAVASDCSPNLSISNDSPYATSNGADASGDYPIGTHIITFIAADGCGNTSSCSMTLIVEDHKPPTPLCKLGISVALESDGTITIIPETLNNGSTDNCTNPANLVFEVSPSFFTCDDIGEQTVELTVTDEAGNSATCDVIILVQDGAGVCPQSSVGGQILTETGREVGQVSLFLSGATEDTLLTAYDGYYEFSGLDNNNGYLITPQKDIKHENGITTFDIIIISKHVLGITALSSPYKIIAADINRSGSVTTFDMVELRKIILQLIPRFTRNTSWRFVRADHNFSDLQNPFLSSFPEAYAIENLAGDILDADFVGVKIGDVNGNANPANFADEGEDRSGGAHLELLTEDQTLNAGEKYTIRVGGEKFSNALGFQFGLGFDASRLEIVGVKPTEAAYQMGLRKEHFAFPKSTTGLMTASWASGLPKALAAGEDLFELELIAREDALLSELLWIDDAQLRAHVYWQGSTSNAVEEGTLGLQFLNPNKEEEIQLFQNFPNPAKTYTTISFYMPQEQQARLDLYNLNGRHIGQISAQNYSSGKHEVRVDISSWKLASGLYYYRLETTDGHSLVKTILVE